MNPQQEFIRETFHALAQPLTSLRMTVELGLEKVADQHAAEQSLVDCLLLIERIMQDLAIFREIANLGEEPAIDACDGPALLQSSTEEMAMVAQASGILLHLNAEPAVIVCHAPTLQRAIFVLLDAIIAGTTRTSKISISLRRCEDEFLLEVRPGAPPGLRQELCRKLMQVAGGRVIAASAGVITTMFRECSLRPFPAAPTADAKPLPTPSPASMNTGVQVIL